MQQRKSGSIFVILAVFRTILAQHIQKERVWSARLLAIHLRQGTREIGQAPVIMRALGKPQSPSAGNSRS